MSWPGRRPASAWIGALGHDDHLHECPAYQERQSVAPPRSMLVPYLLAFHLFSSKLILLRFSFFSNIHHSTVHHGHNLWGRACLLRAEWRAVPAVDVPVRRLPDHLDRYCDNVHLHSVLFRRPLSARRAAGSERPAARRVCAPQLNVLYVKNPTRRID